MPSALTEYLDELVAGRASEAFGRTQLGRLGAFTRGSAVTEDHFVAFFEADPLLSYEAGRVVKYDPDGQDTFWDVEMTLRTRSGSRAETFQVEGEVLSVVTVEPVPLFLTYDGRDGEQVSIDGVSVDLSNAQAAAREDTWQLLVLNGSHRLTIGSIEVTFRTDPIRVLDGPAEVEGDPGSTGAPLTLRIRA